MSQFAGPWGSGTNKGVAGFGDREIVAAHYTGFRMWQIIHPAIPVLASCAFPKYTWTTGVNTAGCESMRTRLICEQPTRVDGHTVHAHTMPCWSPDPCETVSQACGCGFWAYATPTLWYGGGDGPKGPGGSSGAVCGVIHGFGRMVVGTKGFRAERAVIAGLVMPPMFKDWFPRASWKDELSAEVLEARQVQHNINAATAEAGLREAYAGIPMFDSVPEMLEALPLTPLTPKEAA